jgi:PAS domain S-box-containing protein
MAGATAWLQSGTATVDPVFLTASISVGGEDQRREAAGAVFTNEATMTFDLDRFAITLLAAMSDAVVYSDAEGKIQYWNKGAESIFGFAAPEAIGQRLDIIVPANLRQRHWDGYDQTMRTGVTRYGAGDLLAVPAIRKDGSRLSIEFTIVPFKDETGRMLGIAAVMRDVTGRFEEMRALRKAATTLP